mmetsp:Transcript_23236/g.39957  ORF Transcript_23236/g.39957 Transcript_23236/m.39957 type:complete len:200 (+) Transcript_23236:41-640(+)
MQLAARKRPRREDPDDEDNSAFDGSDNTEDMPPQFYVKQSRNSQHQPYRETISAADNKHREGLEEATVRIIRLLQTKGRLLFKDLHEMLALDYRRAYDILNVLVTTPLVSKMGKKRENKLPYMFRNGDALPEPVDLDNLVPQILEEQQAINTIQRRISRLEEALNDTSKLDLARLIDDLVREDKEVLRLPVYQHLLSLH